MFFRLATRPVTNRNSPIGAHRGDCEAQAPAHASAVLSAVVFAIATAGATGFALLQGPQNHRTPQASSDHAQMTTSIPVNIAFEINDVRVTVRSAQWIRQPAGAPLAGTDAAAGGGNPDRVYLEMALESTADSRRGIGRGEFRLQAPNGASWKPLADDFPDIVLGPGEKLAMRLVFELPPQASKLQLALIDGAPEIRIPIGDDAVGGLLGALCRALAKPWSG